ncbi:MAG: hypothetical protein WCF40_07150 [Desulfobacterales bacterium]|jgi:hypothetical protein
MVEKINTGSKWAWVLSPTGVQKAEQRRSKSRQRDFRRNLEDRYSGEGREDSENPPTPGEMSGAAESRAADEAPPRSRSKKSGKLIDIHA